METFGMRLLTFIVTSIATSAPAHAGSIQFTTNLDKPRIIVSARDSLNYRLSDDILNALTEINSRRTPDDQISYRTFGRPFNESDFYSERESQTTISLSRIPETPIIDIAKKNQAVGAPWFNHLNTKIELWMQDALEFFYDGGVLRSLTFKPIYDGRNFRTPQELTELNEINKAWEKDSVTDEEIAKLKQRSQEIFKLGDERAKQEETRFRKSLGLGLAKEISELSGEAGDFEPLPGHTMLTSITDDEGLPAVKAWLQETPYASRVIPFDANWFEVGHVDEFVSVVPAVNECGFAVLTFDPNLGLQLLQKESAKGLSKLIPRDYLNTSPPGGSIPDSGLDLLYDYFVLHKKSSASQAKSFIALQKSAGDRAATALLAFKAEFSRLNPACMNLPVISLPTLVTCKGEGLDQCGTMLPNPVNSIVLDHDLLVPDPFLTLFRQEIKSRLNAAGLTAHFVDSGFYHALKGEAHCATNVIREPAQ